MGNIINRKQVEKIAELANIKLSGNEIDKLSIELSKTIKYVEVLSELQVILTSPTFQTNGLVNIYRGDLVKPPLSTLKALKNAAHTYHGYFMTKPVIGGKYE